MANIDVLLNTKADMGTPKHIVVNNDIDITSHPGTRGETTFNDEATNPLVAFLDGNEKMSIHTAKVVYNCLPPDIWGRQQYLAYSPGMDELAGRPERHAGW